MYRIPLSLHKALERGENPVIYCVIDTHMGRRVYSGKVLSLIPENHLTNADFELWTAGDDTAPDGWTLTGHAGGEIAKESTTKKIGSYSAKITTNTSLLNYKWMYQDIHSVLGIAYWHGRTVTVGAWVWCDVADKATVEIQDGVGIASSSHHPGDSTWRWLTVNYTINGAADKVRPFLRIYASDGVANTAYYDGAVLNTDIPIESSARVVSYGSLERTLFPRTADVLTAYTGRQIQHLSIQLDNSDGYFSRLIAKEPFLSRTLTLYVGLESYETTEHVQLFSGTITDLSVMPIMTVTAEAV